MPTFITQNLIVENGFSANTFSAATISGGTFYGDGTNLTNVLTGATNVGTGLTLSNVVGGNTLEVYSITGDSANKITGQTNGGTIEIGINEQNLDLWDLVVQGNKLLNGSVSWLQNLDFQVKDAEYIIGGVIYTAPTTPVTLQSGDSVYDRIDVIYADTGQTIGVLSGTPSNNPEKPIVDNDYQIEITFVSIPASATTAAVTGLTIYDENSGTTGGEWDFTSFGPQASKINPNYTGTTYSGSKSIEITGFTGTLATTYFVLSSATPIDITTYGSLQFAIKNKFTNAGQTRLYFYLLGSNGNVISSYTQYIWSGASSIPNAINYSTSNNTTWQVISIPLWRFYTTNNSIYGVRILPYNVTSGNTTNIYIDKIEFIEGFTSSAPTSNTWFTIAGTSGTMNPTLPFTQLNLKGGSNITTSANQSTNTLLTSLNSSISIVSATLTSGGQNVLNVTGSGNTTSLPLMKVQGSTGELFNVKDSVSGSVFTVSNSVGTPIFDVYTDNTILMGKYSSPSLNSTNKLILTAGTNTVYSLPTSAYTAGFFDYSVVSTGSTGARAGTIMSIWSGATAQFLDTPTADIGLTTDVSFNVTVSGNNAVLSSSAVTSGWILKTIVRGI